MTTQQDIDELQSAINSGALEVSRGDETVKYRSLADMRDTLREMKAAVAGRPTHAKIRFATPRIDRGF